MPEVILHVYDVTNSGSEKTNNTILQINKIFKDGLGLGGIFHSAVQVYGEEEWSFGFCESGSGVFCCPPQKNPMYTYRESIVLGETNLSIFKVNQILRELMREWPGYAYDLLSKNCNHFCDEFCERLGAPNLPAWVNRFANAGDAASEIAGNTATYLKHAKTEIVSASKAAYRFLSCVTSNATVASDQSSGASGRPNPKFQGAWLRGMLAANIKPSPSSEIAGHANVKPQPPQNGFPRSSEAEELHRQSSQDFKGWSKFITKGSLKADYETNAGRDGRKGRRGH